MTKHDTKEIREMAEQGAVFTPKEILEFCDAYDEAQNENKILMNVVTKYALLEANDNGDCGEPANMALVELGYTEKNPFLIEDNPKTMYGELVKAKNRISTLEALLRKTLGGCVKSFFICGGDKHICVFCDASHFDKECLEHKSFCVVPYIQKEFGEG